MFLQWPLLFQEAYHIQYTSIQYTEADATYMPPHNKSKAKSYDTMHNEYINECEGLWWSGGNEKN